MYLSWLSAAIDLTPVSALSAEAVCLSEVRPSHVHGRWSVQIDTLRGEKKAENSGESIALDMT